MDSIITYKKEIPMTKRIFGFSFAFLGIFMFLSTGGNLMTLIFIVIGFGLNVVEGSDINLTNKTFRTFSVLFGIKVGKWKPIPDFEYVSVFKTKESQTVRVVTAETTQKYDIILVNLFYNRNKHITFYKTNDKKIAFDVAQHFKEALGIDVLDATQVEKKWL
jgi:hypothetical protein